MVGTYYRRRNYSRRVYRRSGRIRTSRGNSRIKSLVDGKKPSWVSTGVKTIPYLVKGLSLVKSMVNAEDKRHDVASSINPTTSGQIQPLLRIAQGSGSLQRIGNSILLKDIFVRYDTLINTSALNSVVRIILICDKQNDGATPTMSQIFQTGLYDSPMNIDNSKRFVVLYDRTHSLSSTGNQRVNNKVFKTLNFHTKYDGPTDAITDMRDNQLYFIAVSSEASDFPTVNFYSRVKYYDT